MEIKKEHKQKQVGGRHPATEDHLAGHQTKKVIKCYKNLLSQLMIQSTRPRGIVTTGLQIMFCKF